MKPKKNTIEKNKKVMKIIDENTSLMECVICGARHMGQIKPESNGKLYYKNWHCQNGCEFISDGTAWNGSIKEYEQRHIRNLN